MSRILARLWPLALLLFLPVSAQGQSQPRYERFDDPLFRRCITWMLDGTGGGLLGNLCVNNFALPSPSQFICSRKILVGFDSVADRDVCAIIFEEQIKKIRAGYIK